MKKISITREIFIYSLTVMKKILSLMEFKLGTNSLEYKYYKKQVMDFFYTELVNLFSKLEQLQLVTKCECNARIRQGYQECPKCGGSGYKFEVEK